MGIWWPSKDLTLKLEYSTCRQNLTEYLMDLKIVSKQPQRILFNLQLLFVSVLLEIFVTNSVDVLVGALLAATHSRNQQIYSTTNGSNLRYLNHKVMHK